MDYIKTSDVSDPNIQQPFTALSLAFLQNASKEAIRGLVYNMIGEYLYGSVSPSTGVVISGCTKAGAGNTIFYGWIFFNGELYYFPGASGLNSFLFTPVFVLDEYADVTIDPVEFSDTISRDVHKIRRLKVVDQLSGTGLFDMSTMGRLLNGTQLTCTSTSTTTSATVTGSSFTTPNRVCSLEIHYTGRVKVTADGTNTNSGLVKIRNVTASTTLHQSATSIGPTVTSGFAFWSTVSGTLIYRNIPANTNIALLIESDNALAAAVTIDNCYLDYKEIVRPAMW